MTARERTLSIFGIAAIVFLAGKWVIFDYCLQPIRDRETRLADAEDTLTTKQFQLMNQDLAQRKLGEWKKTALSDREGSDANVVYKQFISNLFTKAGISNPRISPSPQRSTKDHYTVLPVNLQFDCKMEQLSKLLFYLDESDPHHVVRNLQFQPQQKDDKLDKIVVTMDLEVLLLKDAAGRHALEVVTSSPVRKLQEYSLFAEKNIFQPTNVSSITKKSESKAPADDRSKTLFTGATRGVDGRLLLWFTNGNSKVTVRVGLGEKLEIPGMSAVVLRFDSNENLVYLRVGTKTGTVRFGRDLSTWKEAANEPTTLTQNP